jgi:AcrR family transcriptional regulator
MDTAERLLVEGGSQDAVSIRAIAKAIGCTPPAIYLHFADKDELFLAVCERRFEDLDRAMEEAAAGSDDPLTSLRLRGKAYVDFGLENPEHYRLLMLTPHDLGPHALAPDSPGMRAFQHLVDAVQRCIDTGEMSDEHGAHPVALTLWAAVHGVTSLAITHAKFREMAGDRVGMDRIVDFLLDVEIEGLLSV